MRNDRGYAVHIIESPRDTDLLEDRQERATLRTALKQLGVAVREYLVGNAELFRSAVGIVVRAHHVGGELADRDPIIHVSAHGSRGGIQLTSGDELGWGLLGDVFRAVNDGAAGRLVLGMSTCHGVRGLDMVTPHSALPFHFLVGPAGTVAWSDALIAFASFYHLLAKGIDVHRAVRGMNAAAGLSRRGFRAVFGAEEQQRRASVTTVLQRVAASIAARAAVDSRASAAERPRLATRARRTLPSRRADDVPF